MILFEMSMEYRSFEVALAKVSQRDRQGPMSSPGQTIGVTRPITGVYQHAILLMHSLVLAVSSQVIHGLSKAYRERPNRTGCCT
jgi:hypothetical protein